MTIQQNEVEQMLDLAIKYKEELQKKLEDTWYTDKYKFVHANVYCEKEEIEEHTWSKHQFVSLDKYGNVIGYIRYNVDRGNNSCSGLHIYNFSDNKIVFGMDLGQAIKDIFEKFKFRKLTFCVLVGNPIEESYDKMIKKYNGRIVGIQKKEFKCYDGEYYDKKLYEILREDYMKSVSQNFDESFVSSGVTVKLK